MPTGTLATEVMRQPPRQWPTKPRVGVGAVPGVQAVVQAWSVEDLKTIMKPIKRWSAFYHHHALVVLNNVSDKLFPAMGQLLSLFQECTFYLVRCFGRGGVGWLWLERTPRL